MYTMLFKTYNFLTEDSTQRFKMTQKNTTLLNKNKAFFPFYIKTRLYTGNYVWMCGCDSI